MNVFLKTYTKISFHSLLAIILGSAVLCTYLGGLACKLHMQKTAFAFPLVLSPPASLAVVYLQCRYEVSIEEGEEIEGGRGRKGRERERKRERGTHTHR